MDPRDDDTTAGDGEPEGGDPPCWAHLVDDDRDDVQVRIARAYDPPSPTDGHRVLVDRLWPRGVRRADLLLDDWCREVAPSDALRRWYGHRVERWPEFDRRYRAELAAHADDVARLADLVADGGLTLVCGARDAEHSNAAVLRDVVVDRLRGGAEG